MNYNAVDQAIANLHEIDVPAMATGKPRPASLVPKTAPEFVKNVTAKMMAGEGDDLPVSAIPADGVWPVHTTRWEKRNIALETPGVGAGALHPVRQVLVPLPARHHPHQALRPGRPEGRPGHLQVHRRQGQGDTPARSGRSRWPSRTAPAAELACRSARAGTRPTLNGGPSTWPSSRPLRATERENYLFFLGIPHPERTEVRVDTVKGSQLLQPLFEYSGACAGCGETPYIKLLTQLVGDRLLIGNATGCSSIYGGNLPTTPYAANKDGRGPAWNNSLFEDGAEFSYGLRLTVDKHTEFARELVDSLKGVIGADLAEALLASRQQDDTEIAAQRARVVQLKAKLQAAAETAAGAAGGGSDFRRRTAAGCGRLPGEEERLGDRRRRLGVRHRLWRSRSRTGLAAQHQAAGAEHADVLQHRRAVSPRPRRWAQSLCSRREARLWPRRTLAPSP